MILPGRTIIVTTTDGASTRGISCWSWRWLRMREVWGSISSTGPDVPGIVLVPPHAIVSLQVIRKGSA